MFLLPSSSIYFYIYKKKSSMFYCMKPSTRGREATKQDLDLEMALPLLVSCFVLSLSFKI